MHLILVGTNHKTASVDVRERLYIPAEKLDDVYRKLSSSGVIQGCVILSTCNRIEIYASVQEIDKGFDQITNFLIDFHEVDKDFIFHHIYRKHCEDAVFHLLKVAASLDSMVIGEYEIQGQVRNAYNFASENGFTNNLLNKLFQSAIQAGKVIRNETEIGKGSVSMASVAMELVNELLEDNESYDLLIVGAGEMATLTAQNLVDKKQCSVTVINRSIEKASEIANRFKAKVLPYEELFNAISNHDIVVVSTSANDYIIKSSDIERVLARNGTIASKRFFIDLSVPRNVDPSINELDNQFVYSVDDLQEVVSNNLDKRYNEISKAEQIIEHLSADYFEWYTKQSIMPVMTQLKGELEVIKRRILQANDKELNTYDDNQRIVLNNVLDQYSDKLIKVIMKNLKNITHGSNMPRIAQKLEETFTIDDV